MGWFDVIDVVLKTGILAADVHQARSLRDINNRQLTVEAMAALLQVLRDEIYKLDKTTRRVLQVEAENPKAAAAALALLEWRVDASGFESSIFTSFEERRFADEALDQVRDNSYRLQQGLTPEEKRALAKMVAACDALPEIDLYLQWAVLVTGYRQAEEDKRQLVRERTFWQRQEGVVVGGALVLALPLACGLIGSNTSAALNLFGFLVGGVAGLVVFLYALNQQNPSHLRSRKQEIEQAMEKCRSVVDRERYHELEKKHGSDLDQVRRKREQLYLDVNRFFKNADRTMIRLLELPEVIGQPVVNDQPARHNQRNQVIEVDPAGLITPPVIATRPGPATPQPITSIFCANPECRTQLPAKARFCYKCGTEVGEASE